MQFLKMLFFTFIISITFGAFVANSQELENGIYADMETSKGNIILKLYYKRAP